MGSVLSTAWANLPSFMDFHPPTPAAYTTALAVFQYFPVFTLIEWVLSWYPAGKTSLKSSPFNIPGRLAWFAMEIVGPVNLLYNLSHTTPSLAELPMINKLMVALYCTHYANRAIISPFFSAPSMSPIHAFVMCSAMLFNWFNSSCLSGWLAGYEIPIEGYRTNGAQVMSSSTPFVPPTRLMVFIIAGTIIFFYGMAQNIRAETTLFRLRREEADRRASKRSDIHSRDLDRDHNPDLQKKDRNGNKYHKVYVIPPASGLFRYILYPHFVFEWLEWTGFALVGLAVFPLTLSMKVGTTTTASAGVAPALRPAPWIIPVAWVADKLGLPLPLPAVLFVINAVANMVPHARWGRKWYVEKFGAKAVAGRGAVVPCCEFL
ncbi:Uncharacterized protein PECH_006682 [Penicillium ucsense]|uniref:3-oxo-5-alpha-steroid 4-dehydrogenase C-terminal domain-containing protein n=1 Tax=Penicillium ucsense TaxID=2839758 RepID=A0A8J8WKX5_9EURO|nr:Uncharacterized protein PECM_004371 [Penicillium ucsense]KAF7735379.1 Uncharacterized protein PECH_006682 [Penicillium ucsense]